MSFWDGLLILDKINIGFHRSFVFLRQYDELEFWIPFGLRKLRLDHLDIFYIKCPWAFHRGASVQLISFVGLILSKRVVFSPSDGKRSFINRFT